MLMNVAWSLDLELQFYLCLPLLWLAARRLPGWQLWLLGGAAWGLGLWLLGRGAWSFLAYLPAFVAGMWLAAGRRSPLAGRAVAAAGAFVAAGAGLAIWPETRPLLLKLPGLAPALEAVGHQLWALLLLPLVARVLAGPSSRNDRALGEAAYALYLVHSPVITLLAAGLALHGAALKLVALPVIALATAVLYFGVDRPLETARRRGPALTLPGFAPLNSASKRPN
jgi:peptidoglycan/LPS O-acetylase OafA/YrhL